MSARLHVGTGAARDVVLCRCWDRCTRTLKLYTKTLVAT